MAPFAELPTYSSHPSLRAYLRAVLVAAKDLENIGRYREINGIELYRYVHAFVSSSLTSSFFASLFSAINPSITSKEASRIFNVIQKLFSKHGNYLRQWGMPRYNKASLNPPPERCPTPDAGSRSCVHLSPTFVRTDSSCVQNLLEQK